MREEVTAVTAPRTVPATSVFVKEEMNQVLSAWLLKVLLKVQMGGQKRCWSSC